MTTNISSIHLDILDKDRQDVLTRLIPLTKGFVLGGGTALALQICHRKSFDFDFFSQQPISPKLLELFSRTFSIASVQTDLKDELTFLLSSEIKLTFLHYPFHRSFDLIELENGLTFFSVSDIAIQKAYTIGRRGEYRDYFDLYSILKKELISLERIIQKAEHTYGKAFDAKLFLQQLVYFDDLLNLTVIPIGKEEVPDPDDIKAFFEHIVSRYID